MTATEAMATAITNSVGDTVNHMTGKDQPNEVACIRTPASIVQLYYLFHNTGLILGLHSANERWCYFVTMSLIGWAQA